MKIVLYTQRVDVIESYGERRDCADQNIPRFIEVCGYLPLPLPNIRNIAEKMIEQTNPVGIVLTGGNSLAKYGFCRGMQMILDYFGCKLEQVQRHVAVHHIVSGVLGEFGVNSFHNQGCYRVNDTLEVLAQAQDGVIEAVRHKEKHILGTMWHPERENPFVPADIQRLQKLFDRTDIRV